MNTDRLPPMPGVAKMLMAMLDDGTIDRFTRECSERLSIDVASTQRLVLTVYQDGNFIIQDARNGEADAQHAPDWVTNIDLSVLKDAIQKAVN